MIGWFKRVLGRSPEYNDDELAWSERRASSDGTAKQHAADEAARLRELRGTVDALRNVGPVKAPRSFALTEENLASAGYSEDEISRVLRPGMRRVPIWHRPVLRQLPLAVTALALLIGGYFILSDIDVLVPNQTADPAVTSGSDFQVTVQRDTARVGVTVAAMVDSGTEIPLPTAQAAATAIVGVTRMVERQVQLVTVVVEREVQLAEVEVAREVELQTVEVERMVEPEVTREVQREVKLIEVTVQADITREVEQEVALSVPDTTPVQQVLTEATVAEARAIATAQADLATQTALEAAAIATVARAPTATATPAPAAISETAIPRPTAVPIDTDGAQMRQSTDTDLVRIWPSAVALVFALAGLVAWFELRRRRKIWE